MEKKPVSAFVMGGCACLALATWAASRYRRRQLAGQVVLITGGSRGLGLALAREFAKRRCRLALCARKEDELERARIQLEASGAEVFTVVCDVSEPAAVKNMVEAVRGHFGRIDVLVNNAGEIRVAPFDNLESMDFEVALAVMFWGTVHATLEVLPGMREQGGGRIVNVTSIGGKVSVPHLLAYSCAKAAALAFSEGLRHEVSVHGIKVTTVVPGLMRTGSHVDALFKGQRAKESAWFGVASGTPVITMSAKKAAGGIVRAVECGKSEIILGMPAVILAGLQALFPNLAGRVLAGVHRMLPAPAAGSSQEESGLQLESSHGPVYRFLTTLTRRAGRRLNQPA